MNKYMDSFGLVHPSDQSTSGPSGNGIRFTSEYAWGLYRHGSLSDDCNSIHRALDGCLVFPGLLKRHPTNSRDQESIDDYCARISISQILDDGEFARNFLNYGSNQKFPGWYYNNVDQSVRSGDSWLGRFPALICHAEFVAGRSPPWWRVLYWCLALIVSAHAKRENQDAWALSWHMVKVSKNKGWLVDVCRQYWISKFSNAFQFGMGQLLREYGFPLDHPTAQNLNGDIGA